MSADVVSRRRKGMVIGMTITRTMQGAGIMAQELQIPIFVERELHEWESDRTHTVREDSELLRLCQDYDLHNGIYPEGVEKQWESRQIVRTRVLRVLEKYLAYYRVVVSGHAIMMQVVTGEYKPFTYGEILQKTWEVIR